MNKEEERGSHFPQFPTQKRCFAHREDIKEMLTLP